MNIKEHLEQYIEQRANEVGATASTSPRDNFDIAKLSYMAGTNEMKELLLIAVNALEVAANRKECNHYECCASCGPIYECEEALEQIQEKIKK